MAITVGDQEIKPTSYVRLLGLNIYNELNFRTHIKELCRKAGAKLHAIKRLVKFLNEKECKLLVDAHVISQFNYCSLVWHFCGLTEIHKMEKLHERRIRFVYNEQSQEYFYILKEKKLRTLYGKRLRDMCYETYNTKK